MNWRKKSLLLKFFKNPIFKPFYEDIRDYIFGVGLPDLSKNNFLPFHKDKIKKYSPKRVIDFSGRLI